VVKKRECGANTEEKKKSVSLETDTKVWGRGVFTARGQKDFGGY